MKPGIHLLGTVTAICILGWPGVNPLNLPSRQMGKTQSKPLPIEQRARSPSPPSATKPSRAAFEKEYLRNVAPDRPVLNALSLLPSEFETYRSQIVKPFRGPHEAQALAESLQSPELQAAAITILAESPVTQWTWESSLLQVAAIDFVRDALSINPKNHRLLGAVERLIKQGRGLEANAPLNVRRMAAGNTIELYSLLADADPERAQSVFVYAMRGRSIALQKIIRSLSL